MIEHKKKLKIKLNSVDNLRDLLQEMYDDARKNINEIQNEIGKLTNSVNLKDEIMDGKVKYAKAINDFSVNKNKALTIMIDIAKLMTDVLKFNGNAEKALNESNQVKNWQEVIDAYESKIDNDDDSDKPLEYTIDIDK